MTLSATIVFGIFSHVSVGQKGTANVVKRKFFRQQSHSELAVVLMEADMVPAKQLRRQKMNNGLAKAGFALGTAALATPAGWLLVLGGCLIAAAVDAVSEQQ